MLKIPTKHSSTLSLVISILFMLGCVFCAFLIPAYSGVILDLHDLVLENAAREPLIPDRVLRSALVQVLSYGILAVCMLADVLLFRLLFLVRRGQVFTGASVAMIRGVSWCCFLLGVIFCGFGLMFRIAFVLAFVAVFLGLCLRVVKNVIEEAVEIKEENDLTV